MVMRYNESIANYQAVVDRIERVPGVQSAAPFVYGQGMIRSAHTVSYIVIKGLETQQSRIQVRTGDGKSLLQRLREFHSTNDQTGIVLGTVLADKLHVKPGDTVLLILVDPRSMNHRQVLRNRRAQIIGVFDTGMHQYDGNVAFTDITHLQQMLGIPGRASGIEVRVNNPDDVGEVSRGIMAALGHDFWINHWQHMHRNLFAMLFLQKIMMYVILTLIILVAAFNIASALIMMVKEKSKDIAILKAMGATRSSLQKIFLSKGIVIGMMGILFGVTGGLLICFILSRYPFIDLPGDVYFLTTLPVEIDLLDIGIIVAGTVVICLAASFIPARQASRLNPVEGIRYG
jgi:lipoprotein-releasing system permease protein